MKVVDKKALESIADERLNRLLLERQWLLSPHPGTALELTKAHGVIQTQEKDSAGLSLKARGGSKTASNLPGLRASKLITRATLHRNTIHSLASEDFFRWQPLFRERMLESFTRWGTPLPVSWRSMLSDALGDRAVSQKELREVFARLFPSIPSDRYFNFSGGAGLIRVSNAAGDDLGPRELWTLPDEKLFSSEPKQVIEKDLARRYLAAFGPARATDFSSWTGLPGGSRMLELLQEDLWLGKDSEGKLLYDLKQLSRDEPNTETPEAIVLPAFDNIVLGYGERRRIAPLSPAQKASFFDSPMAPMLWRGLLVATWRFKRAGKDYSILAKPLTQLTVVQQKVLGRELEKNLEVVPGDFKGITWIGHELTIRGSRKP